MIDEQRIIELRKSTPPDVSFRQWGDTIAFARVIEREVHGRNRNELAVIVKQLMELAYRLELDSTVDRGTCARQLHDYVHQLESL